MTTPSVDGVLAGAQPPREIAKAISGTLVAGRAHSFWSAAGNPGAGAFDGTLNGVALSSSSAMVAGQLPHTDPVSIAAYLMRLEAQVRQPGTLYLLDRLWHNGGYTITSTSGQNTTHPGLPARDANGATNGDGVLAAVEVSANVGTGTPTLTVGYTNQAGTAGKTATNILATVASPIIGAFHKIGLAAGDTGMRSIQSLTLSATWTSGTINLVMYRQLAALELGGAAPPGPNAIDALTGGLARLYNGVVPFLVFIPTTTTATDVTGSYVETQV